MTTKLTERIDALENRLATLKNRQRLIDARKTALLTRRVRKEDTRRKILAGAVLLEKVEAGEFEHDRLQRWMDEALKRDDDRGLFGLDP